VKQDRNARRALALSKKYERQERHDRLMREHREHREQIARVNERIALDAELLELGIRVVG